MLRPTFEWAALAGAQEYTFELAQDADFVNLVWTYQNTDAPPARNGAGCRTYYWHVRVMVAALTGTGCRPGPHHHPAKPVAPRWSPRRATRSPTTTPDAELERRPQREHLPGADR